MGTVHCDLALVTATDIQLLRLNDRRNKMRHVKTLSVAAFTYWICDGVIVVAAPPPKQGQLSAFYLKHPKLKHIWGPKFSLDLGSASSESWTAVNQGRLQPMKSLPHKVLLCQVYDRHMIVHMTCPGDEALLYSVEDGSILMRIVCPETGDYELGSKDNLLVFINTSSMVTYIFDIRSYSSVPFCTVLHQPLAESKSMLYAKSECILNSRSTSNRLSSRSSYDPYTSRSTMETVSKEALQVLYCELPEGPFRLTSEDLAIGAGVCYRLELNSEALVRSHPDLLESASFLLRRAGYKVKVFEFIRAALRKQVSLLALSQFFETINFHYKQAAFESRHSFMHSANAADIKCKGGRPGLSQLELCNLVFTPLYEDRTVEDRYLAAVLVEYIRSLTDRGITIYIGNQLVLLRALIRGNDLPTLHQLAQYQIFTDSIEVVQVLLDLDKENPNSCMTSSFQLGIDMLSRIKSKENLALALLSRSMVVESLPYINPAFSKTLRRYAEETERHSDLDLLHGLHKALTGHEPTS